MSASGKSPIITPNKGLDIAAQLAEKEANDARQRVKEYQEKIARAVLAVERVLLEEDMSWQDWHEVVSKFNDRNNLIIPKMKMSELKERYERATA